jgi:hypothetical protein
MAGEGNGLGDASLGERGAPSTSESPALAGTTEGGGSTGVVLCSEEPEHPAMRTAIAVKRVRRVHDRAIIGHAVCRSKH